jgi:thiol:disulfide interchange protein DsbD
MLRLRQLLAFPLYASVLWLAWVLGAQLDNDAVLRLGVALLLVALALWAWQTRRTGGLRAWSIAALASVAAALAVVWPLVAAPTLPGTGRIATSEPGPWHDYAPDRVAQLVSAGRPVFVDFTAAWCVTCQVSQRWCSTPCDSACVRQQQRRTGARRLDSPRPGIGRARRLRATGVPVYVLYRPGKFDILPVQQSMILIAVRCDRRDWSAEVGIDVSQF